MAERLEWVEVDPDVWEPVGLEVSTVPAPRPKVIRSWGRWRWSAGGKEGAAGTLSMAQRLAEAVYGFEVARWEDRC